MSQRIVVAGTDTDVGKTVFSAGLADLLGANYWKPIQAGLGGETDSQLVARLGGLSDDRIVPERYRLETPASPYHAAEIDGVRICAESLDVPDIGKRALVIEGAGGLMVPLSRSTLCRHFRAMATAGRALCAHGAWHHQSFVAVDRGVAPLWGRNSRYRIHWRTEFRQRECYLRDRTGTVAWAVALALSSFGRRAAIRVQGVVQPR